MAAAANACAAREARTACSEIRSPTLEGEMKLRASMASMWILIGSRLPDPEAVACGSFGSMDASACLALTMVVISAIHAMICPPKVFPW